MTDTDRQPEPDEMDGGNDGSLDAGVRALSDEAVGLPPKSAQRAPNGQFAKPAKPASETPAAVAEQKPAEDAKGPKAADDTANDDAPGEEDYVEFELPGEDGKPQTARHKLVDLVDGFQRAQKLEAELRSARTAAPPAELGQELQTLMQERARYGQALKQLEAMLGASGEPDIALLDPNGRNYDPATYYQQHQAHLANQRQRHAVQTQIAEAEAQQKANYDAYLKTVTAQARAHLEKNWPELNTNDGAGKFITDMSAYGFREAELRAPLDPRYYAVLKDALAYRAQKAKAEAAVKIVRAKPKLVPASARVNSNPKTAKVADAMTRLSRSGSMEDAVDALDGLLH